MNVHEEIAALQVRAEEDDMDGSALVRLDELRADRNEDVYDTAQEMIDTIFAALVENVGESFTCTEIESIADLYRALGREASATEVIREHARADEDEDDQHHALFLELQGDDEAYDDGKTLIAGVLYDAETGEEADPQ